MEYPETRDNRTDRLLWIATALGIGAVVFAAVSLSLCLITVGSARLAASTPGISLVPVVALAFSIWTVNRLVLRRPLRVREDSWGAPAITTMGLMEWTLIGLLLTLPTGYTICSSIAGELMHHENMLADQKTIETVGWHFGVLSLGWSAISTAFFTHWWRRTEPQHSPDASHRAT